MSKFDWSKNSVSIEFSKYIARENRKELIILNKLFFDINGYCDNSLFWTFFFYKLPHEFLQSQNLGPISPCSQYFLYIIVN